MRWNTLMDSMYGTRIPEKQVSVWQDELKEIKADNDEVCAVLRWVDDELDYVPRADRERKVSNYTLRDLRIWIFMYRKAKRAEPEFATADSVLGYRRRLIGISRDLYEDGRLVDSWHILTHPDYHPELCGKVRAPDDQDIEWMIEHAETDFGFDIEKVKKEWITNTEESR